MAKQGTELSIKLLIDKAHKKVLFAEAGKECVDFFFHILSLPLGTIVGFLTKESMVGSVGRLYSSLESLSTDYVLDNVDKDCLLNPQPSLGSSSQVPLLTTNHQDPRDSAPKNFYTCITTSRKQLGLYGDGSVSTDVVHRYVSDAAGTTCPQCNNKLDQQLAYVAPPAEVKAKCRRGVGGYVKGVVTYMVMDDLCIKPMSTISTITMLNKLGVQDMSSLEEKEVTLDINMGVALLKASLMSNTALTDVFLPKKP